MVVIKDKSKKGKLELSKISFVEFLEFLGRVAYIAFKDEKLDYCERLMKVLDIVLNVIGLDRLPVPVNVDEDSYSDDEY
jgi:hypothetical protein